MSHKSRREFLEQSMLATAAAVTATSATSVLAEDKPVSASLNEKLGYALIGAGGRGGSHIKGIARRDDVHTLYVVDADLARAESRATEVEEFQGTRPKAVTDLRVALDDDAVDIASVATQNHWHALATIWAVQRGKDVYCEKPVSHNVSEGRRMVEAARKYNKMVQTGTQCRSYQGMRDAMQFVHDGGIGEVNLTRGLCYKRRGSIGPRGKYDVPSSVDYSLYLGPAQMETLTRKRFHYDWHWQWTCGNGDLGNQGIHQMDLARWALGINRLSDRVFSYGGRFGYVDAGEVANSQVIVHEYDAEGKTLAFEVRGLETKPFKGGNVAVIMEGSEGYVVMTSYHEGAAFDKEGKVFKKFSGGGDHYANFIKAVRSRKTEDLNADILEGHLSSALCHMGNDSYMLGEDLSFGEAKERLVSVKSNEEVSDTFTRFTSHLSDNKVTADSTKIRFGKFLTFDSKKEVYTNSSEANLRLTRDYREPFVVPGAGQV